ncbi:hypothetical protein [Perlucidibaca aquatica]|uniref:hypothetical protein n=1 Tax=Perlucidibaca aquatica TaxID=1852776 RepID=UPI00083A48F8|nr:hypothetical protein [Perlucidibaca aquatica]
MHAIFAIEPEAINTWPIFRYAVEKFGYSKGLLIARYPGKWEKMVIEACQRNGVPDVDMMRVVEKLQAIKSDRLVKMGLPYRDGGWRENVGAEDVLNNLSAVLVHGRVELNKFHCIDDAHENLFDNRRDFRVKRSAEALAEAAKHVLVASNSVVLVDGYFQSKRRCTKVLCAMFAASQQAEALPNQVIIFSDHSNDPRSWDVVRQEYKALLGEWIQRGIDITIFRLAREQLDLDIHARYLFNQKAGLRFDRGFVEPEDHGQREHETDVSCIDSTLVNGLYARFIDGRESLSVVDEIVLE